MLLSTVPRHTALQRILCQCCGSAMTPVPGSTARAAWRRRRGAGAGAGGAGAAEVFFRRSSSL
jgi:hypothetical protein